MYKKLVLDKNYSIQHIQIIYHKGDKDHRCQYSKIDMI